MSIETTLGALVDAEPALDRLLALPLAMKPAYHIAKLARLVKAETKIYQDRREKLIKELGEEREPTPAEQAMGAVGTMTAVKAENVKAFQVQMEELRKIDVFLAWQPFALEALGEIKIAGADLLALDALVVAPADLPSAETTQA